MQTRREGFLQREFEQNPCTYSSVSFISLHSLDLKELFLASSCCAQPWGTAVGLNVAERKHSAVLALHWGCCVILKEIQESHLFVIKFSSRFSLKIKK